MGVGLVAIVIASLVWSVRRGRRRAQYEAAVPHLTVEPAGGQIDENGHKLVGFRVSLTGGEVAYRAQLSLRTMRARKIPISEPIVRSAEIPMLTPGQDETVYVDLSRLRPKGQPARYRTEWIHVTARASGPLGVRSQTSWEWRDDEEASWTFLRFTAREPGGRVIRDEKVSGYDWEPPT